MRLAFLACIERGTLEEQTTLLCRSIRRFGGRYRDEPIYTIQPRAGYEISPATADALGQLRVQHRREILNRDFTDYAVGNKIFVCAWAEEVLDRDVFVFLDSDTIFTGEPEALDLSEGFDAAIRPAHSVAHNSSGPGHPMDPYWKRVYKLLGVVDERYVKTELGTNTRAYFSAGLIAVRRRAGLFRQWKADFLTLTGENCLPESGIARGDEIALATTMLRAMDRVKVLDGRYNYLIFKRSQLASPWDRAQLEDLVHVHYRKVFSEEGFLRRVRPALRSDSDVLAWIEEYLPLGRQCAPVDRTSPFPD